MVLLNASILQTSVRFPYFAPKLGDLMLKNVVIEGLTDAQASMFISWYLDGGGENTFFEHLQNEDEDSPGMMTWEMEDNIYRIEYEQE